ncbi:MAG: DUF4835 family protein [Paludibacteraceae bacterium]|nr:DUF4835 family protein [Paludibacteraceae bacterium]
MKRLLVYSLLLLSCVLSAQELNCNVIINHDQVQGTNVQIFTTLEQSIREFINTQRWTDMTVAEQERIECTIMIIVSQVSTDGLFTAQFQVQSRRPVYKTGYQSTLVNMQDNDCSFQYQEFDRLEFQPNQFTSNLSSLLAFYCYYIIAMDADSYSKMGGKPYFQQCENIVTVAQSASIGDSELAGWKAMSNNKNRYALINQMQDQAFQGFREYIYTYHRLGLDIMSDNVANGRARIAQDIEVLREANRARPATYVVYTFMDAKNDELVQLFSKGTDEEKKKVYDVCMAVDPTRQEQYDKINKK